MSVAAAVRLFLEFSLMKELM